MRKFYIQAGNGLRYDLQNKSKCFLNNPDGLGFEKDNSYIEVGNYFSIDDSKNNQKSISGELIFVGDWYSNYNEFITFIKSYDDYKLVYDFDGTLYFIDIDIVSVSKGDTKGNKYLSCDLQMKGKSLWYKTTSKTISVDQTGNLSQWDFNFDLRFNDSIFDNIQIENNGQVKTPYEIEITGAVVNPKIEIYQNNEKINEFDFTVTLSNSTDKILYGNEDNNLYVYKVVSGVQTNAFDTLDLSNDNWFKLPIGSSIMKVTTSTGTISSIKITYYEEYEAV